MQDLLDERQRLLGLLVKRAEKKATVVFIERRPVWYGSVKWPVISASLDAYRKACADQLRAVPAQGALSLDQADIALEANLGMGYVRPSRRGAKRRLRELLIVSAALRGLGEGLRFGELLAATNLKESRLDYILCWAAKQRVLVDAGEYGWFFRNSAEYWRIAMKGR